MRQTGARFANSFGKADAGGSPMLKYILTIAVLTGFSQMAYSECWDAAVARENAAKQDIEKSIDSQIDNFKNSGDATICQSYAFSAQIYQSGALQYQAALAHCDDQTSDMCAQACSDDPTKFETCTNRVAAVCDAIKRARTNI